MLAVLGAASGPFIEGLAKEEAKALLATCREQRSERERSQAGAPRRRSARPSAGSLKLEA